MPFDISKRVSAFETLIFSELVKYKKKKQAEGKDMIDLSIGSPDQPAPPFIINELAKNIQDPKQYGYTLTGTDEFHKAVSHYYKNRFNVQLDPDAEALLLMGSQDGIIHLPLVFCDPGDYILVPDPGYTAYDSGILLAEARKYTMPLKRENGFLPDIEAIPAEIAKQTKMMILNFPGNPVPALADKVFYEKVVAFAKQYDILVVHDFAYCELVFDGQKAVSFLEAEGAKDVGVEFNSLSKSFNMAGMRIGYMTGNSDVIAALAKLKSNMDYGVFLPIQKAAVKALTDGEAFLQEHARAYERRRDVLVQGLREIGWHVDSPPATMFVWAKIPEGWTSLSFVYELMDKAGVVVTPGNAFGEHGEGYVRIAMVQDEMTLKKSVERIKKSGLIHTAAKPSCS
ncbi:aspartate/methionine/tyrosine aminotransferase [Scopulibacillus darangshiensis]|uniref:Aminotransferase n=1 Tax=Scopulibacillus darangshiensis TaxID=442528 RepID=A0A4R2NHB5_9BACL|nr:LL-diaminopimelate aminotransferase [Scopulibacillus darangshiensis]TCP20648.1 aspartate/methionine/tyrosine aminotransferase [Scopulibacillus darangshiensis]